MGYKIAHLPPNPGKEKKMMNILHGPHKWHLKIHYAGIQVTHTTKTTT
jgi:hypothetical protein